MRFDPVFGHLQCCYHETRSTRFKSKQDSIKSSENARLGGVALSSQDNQKQNAKFADRHPTHQICNKTAFSTNRSNGLVVERLSHNR